MKYFVRPEKGQEDVIGPTFGPFEEFIQMTYGGIRVGPNGESIGSYDNGLWFFGSTYPGDKEVPIPCNFEKAYNCPKDYLNIGFTDVVIWAE